MTNIFADSINSLSLSEIKLQLYNYISSRQKITLLNRSVEL